MSSLIFNQSKNIPLPLETAEAPAADYFDVVDAAGSDQVRNKLGISKDLFTNALRQERALKFKEITGQDIGGDLFKDAQGRPSLGILTGKGPGVNDSSPEYLEAVNKKIQKLRTEDPEKYSLLKTDDEINAQVISEAKAASLKSQKVMAGADDRPFFELGPIAPTPAGVGNLVGTIGGDMVDPANILSAPIGAVKGMGVMKRILMEAGINMAAETSRQPEISEWQKEVGNKYGWTDMAENVGLAGLFGGTFAAAKELTPLLGKSAADTFEAIKLKAREKGAPTSVLDVIEQQGREAHVMESNPFKDTPELDTGGHMKSIDEVQNAMREGRPIRTENLGVTDAEIRAIETNSKIDVTNDIDAVKADNARKLDELMGRKTFDEAPANVFNAKEDFHPEVFRDADIEPKEVSSIYEAAQVRADQEFAPDNIKSHEAEFDALLSRETAENFPVDYDGVKTDIATLKQDIQRTKKLSEAIKVCSIGGA